MAQEPRTLMEAVRYFADPDVALQHMVELRWRTASRARLVAARTCASSRRAACGSAKRSTPRKQFSAKVGTIFEDSAIPLDKWFVAIWMVANCKNGISSYEMGRSLGVTQKSAWHMNHRIRLAMKLGTIEKMDGECEADETYIGGMPRTSHVRRRAPPRQAATKPPSSASSSGPRRSPSRVRASVIPDTTARHPARRVSAIRRAGSSTVSTDEHGAAIAA